MEFLSFCVALFFIIFGVLYSIIRLARGGPLFSRDERIVIYILHFVIYTALITPVIALLAHCVVELIINDSTSMVCRNVDSFRVIYETRSISGSAETVTVASIAILIPFLVALWNDAKQTILRDLDRLRSLRNEVEQRALQETFQLIKKKLILMDNIGKELTVPFWFIVLFTVLYLSSLACSNLISVSIIPSVSYLLVITQKAFAILLLLLFLTLLSMFFTLVQPLTRKSEYFALYEKSVCEPQANP